MSEPTSTAHPNRWRRWYRRDIERPLEQLVGGPARLKIIVLLACVLGLDAADKATVGAVATQLEQALGIGYVEIGWLVTASTAVGAVVTLPFGLLADRIQRARLLAISIAVWSLTMLVSSASTSYLMLLLSRLLLGVAVAAVLPAVTSLTGDFFRPSERGRIFGYILAGELVGVAFGFLIAGNVAAVLSWRVSFLTLAVIGLGLAFLIWRFLPEPARGGQSHIPVGATQVPATQVPASEPSAETSRHALARPPARRSTDRSDDERREGPPSAGSSEGIEKKIAQRGIKPRRAQLLDRDPVSMSLWQAVRYIFSVRTFRTLALASALGYFYFTGLRTFAIVFMRGRFGLSQAMASTGSVGIGLGAIVGVLIAGRLGDGLIVRGRLNGRVLVATGAYLLATAAFIPGLLASSLWVAGPFFFVAAAGVGGANPVVDAARLDVMNAGLWGRAEGVRATLRFTLEAIAPPLFGYVAALFAGHSASVGGAAAGAGTGAEGLQMAFLVMLVPLALAGLVLWLRARKTYARDVATAMASERCIDRSRGG